jgi:NADPH2:quinone reductase
MIKAILIKEHGDPEVLKVVNVSFRKPKKNEAIVRHTAIGINYLDIEQRKGIYKLKDNTNRLKLPSIIGCEATGVVEELGEGSTADLKRGDRVCYATIPYGAYAEKRLIDTKYLIKIPSGIQDEVVAGSLYKGLMAFYLTSRAYLIHDDITVMVHDATSDIARILCQFIKGKSSKCKIIGTINSNEKFDSASNLGCDLILNYHNNQEKLHKEVLDFTNGLGVSAVYDCVGKDTYLFSLNSLRMFGIYLLYEQRSGAIPPMNWQAFRARSLFFTYPSVFHYAKSPVEFALSAAEVFHFLKHKKIIPRIAKHYKFDEITKAHKDFENNLLDGSAVVML